MVSSGSCHFGLAVPRRSQVLDESSLYGIWINGYSHERCGYSVIRAGPSNESRISCVLERPQGRKMASTGHSTRSGRSGTTASCAG